MIRPALIVVLAGLMLATGVAGASPANTVRVPISVGAPSRSESEPQTVVVREGDHLWKISADHIERLAPGTAIAPYWREVVDVNTPHLRSRNPDLIYPGEMVQLPRLSAQP